MVFGWSSSSYPGSVWLAGQDYFVQASVHSPAAGFSGVPLTETERRPDHPLLWPKHAQPEFVWLLQAMWHYRHAASPAAPHSNRVMRHNAVPAPASTAIMAVTNTARYPQCKAIEGTRATEAKAIKLTNAIVINR